MQTSRMASTCRLAPAGRRQVDRRIDTEDILRFSQRLFIMLRLRFRAPKA
jgi:hypothetical protein